MGERLTTFQVLKGTMERKLQDRRGLKYLLEVSRVRDAVALQRISQHEILAPLAALGSHAATATSLGRVER